MKEEEIEILSLIDELKIYLDGLLVAVKQKKFGEALEYVNEMKDHLTEISIYVESRIS